MKLTSLIVRLCGALALGLALAGTAFGQGLTTAAVSGFVMNQQGSPVAGATVTITHEPTGTKSTAVTRSNGQYNATGLRVGGPYTIAVSAPGLQVASQKDVYLTLENVAAVNFDASADVVKMEAFRVSESTDTTFDANRMGSGRSFTERDIASVATARDNVQDIARLDSRITLNSLDQGGQLSAQGQNFRFNSFLVDGVESNDPFGLKGDGTNALRSPVALESLAAVDVQLNPVDLRRGNFTGVLINTITKTGSNEFHGGVKYTYSDQDMRAKNPNPASTLYGTREAFKERTWNFEIGGPIVPNRLFFYLNYDDYRREAAPPSTNFRYTDQTQIDAIVARARALGYDPGSLGGATATLTTQKTKLAKLDWNITDSQRLSLTYRDNDGTTPNFASLTSVFGQSFSNYWYDTPQTSTVYTGVLNSQWTPDFHTEATVTYTEWDGTPQNRGAPFPEVTINGLTGIRGDTGATITTGSVRLGTEFSRQLNVLRTEDWQGKLNGDYSLGDHTITVGGEFDRIKYYNAFAQAFYGSYTFATVANWQAGTPAQAYTDAKLNPGFTLDDAIARWKYTALAGFVQDTWKPNSRLTIAGGLRIDYPYVPQKPPVATGFQAAFGFPNNTTNSDNWTLAPRVGFNYRVPADRKTEVRGSVGLYQGRNPAVWISNAYSQAGVLGTVSNPAGVTFVPDVTRQPTPTGTLAAPNINITDPDFRQPAVWKGTLAVDHQLPFGGFTFSATLDAIKTYKALAIQFLNYQTATTGPTTMPDGRIRYAGNITPAYGTFPTTNLTGRRRITTGGPTGGGFADVYLLTNTNKGDQKGLTLSLSRPVKNHWGANFAWTRSNATEVSPMTSSTAGSLYGLRAVFNPNEDVASRSNTNTKDKLVASLTGSWEFIKGSKTSTTLTYIGQTGHNYSWTFKGDANGDGFADNDLFYMPTGPSDPRVRWAVPAEQDAFFAYAAQQGLTKYGGSVIPRNDATSPWNNTLDLTIIQDIPGVWRVKPQFILQCVNFGNLLKKSWGLLEETPFSYRRSLAGATYDPAGNGGQGQYVYVYNQNTLGAGPLITTLDPIQSRWHLKAAIKLSF